MRRILAALALVAVAAPASAARWAVAPAQSRVAFTANWLGKPVVGVFRSWSAVIDFEPAAPAKANIAVTVDLTSATTGDKTVDGSLPEADWFAVASGKTARFVSTKVATVGPGRYVATGTLTIRGHAVPVTLPFALAIAGDTATMTGQAQLDRRSWKLGIDSDATAEYVAFAVPLSVKIVAKRLP